MRGRFENTGKARWHLKLAIIKQFGTEAAFAKKIGITKSHLTHIVVGRYPGWTHRKKIVAILGYPEEWLFQQGDNGNGKDR